MTKKEIRAEYKNRRKQLTQQELDASSVTIFERVADEFNLTGKKVSIFLPIMRFQEINTWLFIDHFTETEFFLPVIRGDNQLVHIKYENRNQIEITEWGIPEPTSGDQTEPANLDMVFVPLLAVDQKGYRVGYGKGFYDRFLSQCNSNCLFIGLSYFEPIASIADRNEFDIPLHCCVTPNNLIKFK